MIKVKQSILKIKDPDTNEFISVPIVVGDSAYEIALRYGFEGTEEEWLKYISGQGGHADVVDTAEKTQYLKVDYAIGNEAVGVYFNSNGTADATGFTLKDGCQLDVSDNPDEEGRVLMSNLAVQEALSGLVRKAMIPTVNGKIIYTGQKQSPSWLNFDSNILSISGETEGVNAGTYTAIFTPRPPYLWQDGTEDAISVKWSIEKADAKIYINTTTVALSPNKLTEIIEINRVGDGVLSVNNSNVDIVSAILMDDDTLTITGNGLNSGTSILTLSLAGNENYNAASNVSITVTASYLNIVSWAGATEIEIANMLTAHYNGEIDIADYWAVGDTRNMNLSQIPTGNVSESQPAQTVELVIIGIEHDELLNPIKSKSRAAITVQVKNCLSEIGCMHSASALSAISWAECVRREWCNLDFKNALPTTISKIVKPVIKLTNRFSTTESERTHATTNDSVFLPSEWEMFGAQSLSKTEYGSLEPDGIQYEYMNTASNRIKQVNGVDVQWWCRTSYSGTSYEMYLSTSTDGDVVAGNAGSNRGIAPVFCL